MSSNLSVINFTAASLTVSGTVTLSSVLNSSSNMDIQGMITSTLEVTGISTFNGSLPTSTKTVTSNSELTTKTYVDGTISNTDSARKLYIDSADGVLDTRITDTDADQRLYIDTADGVLDTRITDTDADQRLYIDTADSTLNTRITNTDADQRLYIDTADDDLKDTISSTSTAQKIYIDEEVEKVRLKPNPLCYVHQTSNNTQTVPNNAISIVGFSTTLYNSFQRYDFGEDQFRPTSYAGFYQLNTSVCLPNINSGYIAFYKNGQEYSRGSSFSSSLTNPNTTLTASTIMYFNGSTVGSELNYCDVRVICTPSTVISGSLSKTYFTAHWIQN
jgi:hypothetical protein